MMSDQYRQLVSYASRSWYLGAAVSSCWRWAGLRLTSRGFMAA
jgi:hypothetical protein